MEINIYKTSCLILLFILCFSCKKDNENNSRKYLTKTNAPHTTLYLDHCENKSVLNMSSVFSKAKPIILELKDSSLIGKVNKMEEYNNQLIVLDRNISKSIFIFDINGKFLFKIGEIGSGPGEFTSISDYTIDYDNNIIYVLDDNTQFINIFNLEDGGFINRIDIKKDDIRSYNLQYIDGVLYADVFHQGKNRNNSNNSILRTIDIQTGLTIDLFLNVGVHNKGFNDTYLTGRGVFFSRNRNPVFIQMFGDTIISLSNNQITPHIVLNSKDLIVNKDLEKSKQNAIRNSKNSKYISVNSYIYDLKKFHSFKNFIESDKFFLINCYFKNFAQIIYHNKINNETTIYNTLKDDVLFEVFDLRNNKTSIDFLHETSDGVYAIITNKASFIEAMHQYKLRDDVIINNLSEINDESNPMIIFYEFK